MLFFIMEGYVQRAPGSNEAKRSGNMTDKEFKRLSRSQLIDIIYQLQLKQEELTADREKLVGELADKRLRVSEAGNVAEAALKIHHVMQAAEDAAAHYKEEMQIRADEEYARILKEANEKATAILEQAAAILGTAEAILEKAKAYGGDVGEKA
jgi:predicted  nucleic acid-binding Zn-ribbon protein